MMKTQTIEQISGETCVEQIKALRSSYLNEQEEHCRTCQDYSQDCYRPVKTTSLPIRHGRFAII